MRAQSPGLARLKLETRTQGYVHVANDIRNLRISFAALDADSTSAEIASYSAGDAKTSGAEPAHAYAATMKAQHLTLRWEKSHRTGTTASRAPHLTPLTQETSTRIDPAPQRGTKREGWTGKRPGHYFE